MLELPVNIRDIIALTDWLELKALTAGDNNASAGDLQNALQIALRSESAKEQTINVILEVEERIRDAGESYPFELQKSRILQTKNNIRDFTAYIFCLYITLYSASNHL